MVTIFFKKYFSISKFESRSMCASTSFIISIQIIIYWQNFKLKKSTPSVFPTFWCDIKLKRILRLSLEVKVFDNLINYNLLTASHKKKSAPPAFSTSWYDMKLRLTLEIPLGKWRWLIISSIRSCSFFWKLFLVCKLHISNMNKLVMLYIVSFCEGLSLTQISISYHVWKLRYLPGKKQLFLFPLLESLEELDTYSCSIWAWWPASCNLLLAWITTAPLKHL